jgi:ADP-ribose pyrophosphatase YjhB (NUDIX family)
MGITMDKILVSGPVIIKSGKLLLVKDNEDDFYKLPGGGVEPGETLEGACKREAKEEINARLELRRELSPYPIDKEGKRIELHHYLATLLNPHEIRPIYPITEMAWLGILEIKRGRYKVGDNITYLINRGEIK